MALSRFGKGLPGTESSHFLSLAMNKPDPTPVSASRSEASASEPITRRQFTADSTLAVAGAVVASQAGGAFVPSAAAQEGPESFQSQWDQALDRVWLGPDVWANPMQDWRVAGGRIECTKAAPDRNVHVLTHQTGDQEGTLEMSVKAGRVGGGSVGKGKGSFGFRIGILGTLGDYPELHDFRNNLWPAAGAGFDAGIASDGTLFVGAGTKGKVETGAESLELSLKVAPAGKDGQYDISLTVKDAANGKVLGEATAKNVPGQRLIGNLALVNNFGAARRRNQPNQGPNYGTGQFWFSDWKISGTKLTVSPEQTFGPILFSQYTVSHGILKLTAQMPPLGAEDEQSVTLELGDGSGGWKEAATETIHPLARTATFRVEGWDSTKDVPYRLRYGLKEKSGEAKTSYWEGKVRKDPVDKDELVIGDVSCNIHMIFPNVPFTQNMAKLDPDLLAFVGDQFYENCGGYGTFRDELRGAVIDYLRKWYFHGWTWRELTRDRPSLSLPDDHDVYQGNLWGEGGAARETTQEAGGYEMPVDWVNVVHRTQTSHHPDPYDSTPCKRGTSNYYGPMTYGRVSFAVLADRQYKTGPEGEVPPTGDRGDHVINPEFDPKTADLEGLDLLGANQMAFLRDWVSDWRGAEMKAVVSQTIFTAMATTHGGNLEVLYADYDANGWPQAQRNEALRVIRKAFAFHLAGDQHLPAVVHYGVDEHRDAGAAFAGPAVNVGYPRWWEPEKTHRNKKTGTEGLIGDFDDHFGNPLTVLAVKNGPYELPKPVLEMVNAKTSGLGLVRINKAERTFVVECWPYSTDPAQEGGQMEGWPVTLTQRENYGRKAAAHLPTLKISGVKEPLVEVVEDATGELVYAIRLRPEETFQPHVFAEGAYAVKVSEPETGRSRTLTGLQAKPENGETVEVTV